MGYFPWKLYVKRFAFVAIVELAYLYLSPITALTIVGYAVSTWLFRQNSWRMM